MIVGLNVLIDVQFSKLVLSTELDGLQQVPVVMM